MPPRRMVQGSNFVGSERGMSVTFALHDDGSVRALVVLDDRHMGPPGYAHGGALAALLDEAMGASAWAAGHRVVAVNLNVSFKHPVAIGAPVNVSGFVERVEGRKVFAVGQITLADGALAAESTGVFVEAPQFFERAGFTFEE